MKKLKLPKRNGKCYIWADEKIQGKNSAGIRMIQEGFKELVIEPPRKQSCSPITPSPALPHPPDESSQLPERGLPFCKPAGTPLKTPKVQLRLNQEAGSLPWCPGCTNKNK